MNDENINTSSNKNLVKQDDYIAILKDDEESALDTVKMHWLLGEWEDLVALDIKVFSHHAKRDRFAILIASAFQQLGEHAEAKKYVRLALEWGCPSHLVACVLVADVHNTLGKISFLKKDNQRIDLHFQAAVNIENNQDSRIAHSRSFKEVNRLGLLSQAADLLDDKLKNLSNFQKYRPYTQQAQIKMFQTELELLHHELSLAQQRQQLSVTKKNLNELEVGSPEWKAVLERYAVSQLGQDIWVLEKTNYKRGGFFVEFGATDGILLSNSYLLEKEFDWNGICAEPNPKFYEQLKQNRNCIVSNECIGAKTGEQIEFVLADAYGGMLKHAEIDKQNTARRLPYADLKENVVTLDTISLHDFLVKYNAPKKIDYLSIDTEGSEFEILQAFPFDDWNIGFITVEHNFTEQRELIYQLLSEHGYVRIESKWDDYYIKKTQKQINYEKWVIPLKNKYIEYPHIVAFETFAQCNASCSFCPYSNLSRKGEKMSDSLMQKIISDLKDIPPEHSFIINPSKVNEPFLDKRLLDICELIEKELPNASIILISNGSVLTEKHVERLSRLSNILYIKISLNDYREFEYEELMQLDFKKTIKKLKMLHNAVINEKIKFPITITRVADGSNADSEFLEFCSTQFPAFRVNVAGIMDWLGDVNVNVNVTEEVLSTPCAQWFTLNLLPNGDETFCCIDVDGKLGKGNIKNTHALSLYNDPFKKKLRETLPSRLNVQICKHCSMLA